MSHLTIISNDTTSEPRAETGQSTTRPARCCPISRADEFSYRNPSVLGESLASAGQNGVKAALRGDREDTERMLSWLADRTADATALDDHTQRHIVEGICNALERAIAYAQYRHANPEAYAQDDLDEDDDSNEDEGASAEPVARPNMPLRPPSDRIHIRIRRSDTHSAVTPITSHADSTNTTH